MPSTGSRGTFCDINEERVALNCNSVGEEADPSTIGRAGVTLRPPMVVLRSIGGGIDMVGDVLI